MRQPRYQFWFMSAIALLYLVMPSSTQAQIVPDATLPVNSAVTVDGNTNNITGGTQAGRNLFHSFEQFSVNPGSTAYFNNASDIQNIFSRVTGSSISQINGLIQTNPSASLFLINPNGIIFGANASLNVGGSFIASTASRMIFADGTQFTTTSQDAPLLTVSVPVGLQFGQQAGAIRVLGAGLAVPASQTLALVGGDLQLEGGALTASRATGARTLQASQGRIELGSVAASSLVSLSPSQRGWTFGYENVQQFEDIELAKFALVDTSGESGGDVKLQGNQIRLSDGTQIGVATRGAGAGGNLVVNAAESLELAGNFQNRFYSGLFAVTDGSGNAGNLEINTQRLVVQDGATITVSTRGRGNAGNLTVRASTVDLSGTGTSAIGTVVPSGLFAQVLSGATGKGGNLTIATERLQVRGGARVATSTAGTGNAGNLTVRAATVILRGTSADGSLSSGLFARANPQARGSGGDLNIVARNLNIDDKAEVTVSSLGTGNAGNLDITANAVRLDNSGKLTAATASGEGGNIRLNNLDLLLLGGNSEISTSAGSAGNGGNINVDTNNLVLAERSNITARAVEGRGGNISITTQGLFVSPDSTIDATSDRGINGIVEIRRPDVDPSAELVILPADVVDVSGLVAQGCSVGGIASGESSFAITGRGGLPPTPAEATRSESILVDLGVTEKSKVSTQKSKAIPTPLETSNKVNPVPLVEATGWVVGSNGEVVLTAAVTNNTLNIPWFRSNSCNGT